MTVIGFDFDNTIVNYQLSIKQLAWKHFGISKSENLSKEQLRKRLIGEKGELVWTHFQGELYGPGMQYASPSHGFKRCAYELKKKGYTLKIISHRTKYPYDGKKYNLHKFAKSWVTRNLNYYNKPLFDRSDIFFFQSIDEKISHIKNECCYAFIDDLEKVLDHSLFPPKTIKILYDPIKNKNESKVVIDNWNMLVKILSG